MSDYMFEFDSKKRKATCDRVLQAAAEFRERVMADQERHRRDTEKSLGEWTRDRQTQDVHRAYTDLGIDPPDTAYPISIDLLVHLGWAIEADAEGKLALTRPLGREVPTP